MGLEKSISIGTGAKICLWVFFAFGFLFIAKILYLKMDSLQAANRDSEELQKISKKAYELIRDSVNETSSHYRKRQCYIEIEELIYSSHLIKKNSIYYNSNPAWTDEDRMLVSQMQSLLDLVVRNREMIDFEIRDHGLKPTVGLESPVRVFKDGDIMIMIPHHGNCKINYGNILTYQGGGLSINVDGLSLFVNGSFYGDLEYGDNVSLLEYAKVIVNEGKMKQWIEHENF